MPPFSFEICPRWRLKGMHHSPHDRRGVLSTETSTEYRFPGTTLHIRWLWISPYLFPFFIRRWIAGMGPFSPGPLRGLYLTCFSFVLFGLPFHFARNTSLDDSQIKIKEQELSRGGLDNDVITSQYVRKVKDTRPWARICTCKEEAVLGVGRVQHGETLLLRSSWRGL